MRVHIFVKQEHIYRHLKKKFVGDEVSPFSRGAEAIQETIANFQADVAIVEVNLKERVPILHILQNFNVPVLDFKDDFDEVIRGMKKL